jgi:hypothetical protein
LRTGDPNVDSSDGHLIAYEKIYRGSQEYDHPPIFLKEDSDHVLNDDLLSGNVQEWMAISQQVATGSLRRVLENGREVWNSSDEDDEEMMPDELTGMYTAEMDPKQGPQKLTQRQVALQKAAYRQSSIVSSEISDSDCSPAVLVQESKSIPDYQDLVEGARKRTSIPRSPSAGNLVAPTIKTWLRAVADPHTSGTKASARTADVLQPTKEQKAPKQPVKGQESPVAKATHPMVTRQRASGAGGLRSGGGSGQTDTCVAQGNPSKT